MKPKDVLEEASKEFPCFNFEFTDFVSKTTYRVKALLDLNAVVDIDYSTYWNNPEKAVMRRAIRMIVKKFLSELKFVVPTLEEQPNISPTELMKKIDEELGIK